MRIYQYLARTAAILVLFSVTLAAQAQEENMDTILDIHHVLGYLVAAFLITVFVMIFYNRVIYYREQGVTKQAQQLNAQLGMILDSNKTEAWTFDINQQVYKLLSEQGKQETIYSPIDFSQFYDRDDFSAMNKALNAVRDGEELSGTLYIKSAPPKVKGEEQHVYEVTISTLRRDKHGRPLVLLGTQHNVTHEQKQAQKTQRMMRRFQTIFDSSLVDMIYFDANGVMTDINDKACESYIVKDKKAMLARKPTLDDFPTLRDLDLQNAEETYVSSIIDLSKVDKPIGNIKEDIWGGKRSYYERNTTLIRNHRGELAGIVMAGRNITDMVNSQHHQREANLLLEQKTKEIEQYIQNINYSLRVSEVRLMNYYPDSHELQISSDLNRTQYRLSQIRVISLIAPEHRLRARRYLLRMDKRHEGIISETLQTILKDSQGRNVFLHFNVMPIYDKDGQVSHYFGMCRNETESSYTEMRLKEETEKAQEAELLKDTFLLNMSYELRTPLNAVIGFAELFGAEHSEEDEPIFAEEIKKNTNTLLKLINDILFISRLDAHMIEHNYQEADFALMFEGWCYMGWSNMDPGVKTVVENPYSRLIVEIDQQNLAMVIQKLCIYSGLTTKEGTVRAKYEYRKGELMITIEDTGKGMDDKMLQRAFDRFVREEGDSEGTGLDLPIVKELVEQMNGTLELQSELGKGKSFFVSIPCKMIEFDKKAEIMI